MWFHESAKEVGNFCLETDESFSQKTLIFSILDS